MSVPASVNVDVAELKLPVMLPVSWKIRTSSPVAAALVIFTVAPVKFVTVVSGSDRMIPAPIAAVLMVRGYDIPVWSKKPPIDVPPLDVGVPLIKVMVRATVTDVPSSPKTAKLILRLPAVAPVCENVTA